MHKNALNYIYCKKEEIIAVVNFKINELSVIISLKNCDKQKTMSIQYTVFAIKYKVGIYLTDFLQKFRILYKLRYSYCPKIMIWHRCDLFTIIYSNHQLRWQTLSIVTFWRIFRFYLWQYLYYRSRCDHINAFIFLHQSL